MPPKSRAALAAAAERAATVHPTTGAQALAAAASAVRGPAGTGSQLEQTMDVGHNSSLTPPAPSHDEGEDLNQRWTASMLRTTSAMPASGSCPIEARAREFLQASGIEPAYLDPRHDRCFCSNCYVGSKTVKNEGPTPYVVPVGWVRFGLAVPPRATDPHLAIFDKWSVSFHGVKNTMVLRSILQCGQLMKAGDRLLDGAHLTSTKCAGRQDQAFYTSPTIKYAGLKFYAEPQRFGPSNALASMVLQCRQQPGSFRTRAETMRFSTEMPNYLAQECPHVDPGAIEWLSDAHVSTLPYGLLIRTFEAFADTNSQSVEYSSPLDSLCPWFAQQIPTWTRPTWVPDAVAQECMAPWCSQRFDALHRRHHCRYCGKVFCKICCKRTITVNRWLEDHPPHDVTCVPAEKRLCFQCYQIVEAESSHSGEAPLPTMRSEEEGLGTTATASIPRESNLPFFSC
jgi:hypothetical protein